MGKISLDDAQSIVDFIKIIYSSITTSLHLVSQTYVFKLDANVCPVNLHHIAKLYKNDVNVRFECELFPALSLHYWRPVHVNVFSNGKVVVLGNNSRDLLSSIYNWLFMNILLLPNF